MAQLRNMVGGQNLQTQKKGFKISEKSLHKSRSLGRFEVRVKVEETNHEYSSYLKTCIKAQRRLPLPLMQDLLSFLLSLENYGHRRETSKPLNDIKFVSLEMSLYI